MAFSPDGRYSATGEFLPGEVMSDPPVPVLNLYDIDAPKTPFPLPFPLRGTPASSPPSASVPTASNWFRRASIKPLGFGMWSRESNRPCFTRSWGAGGMLSPDGKRIAAGSEDRTVKLWAPPDSSVMSFPAGEGPQNSVEFSPDGRRLAASSSGKVIVWDLRTESELKRIGAGWCINGWPGARTAAA